VSGGSHPQPSAGGTVAEPGAAIVTGGGRGLGEAAAYALAAAGRPLVLVSRTPSELERVAAAVRQRGGAARTVSADVSRPEDVDRVARAALDAYGPVEVLVNAAGVYGPIGVTWEVDPAQWVRALHVNLVGTFLCCRAVLPQMIARRRGKIINFSGGGATAPLARFSAYGVSKAAVVRLTETLAEEAREFDVQINAIAPGAVDTRLQDDVLEAGERAGPLAARIRELRESGRGGVPPTLAAELVAFLASDAADGLTGKLIAAPYDDWRSWDAARIAALAASPWLTLRRLDRHTLAPLVRDLTEERG